MMRLACRLAIHNKPETSNTTYRMPPPIQQLFMTYKNRYWHVIIPLMQILFYLAANEVANYLAHKWHLVYARGVQWGIAAEAYAFVYIVVTIALAIVGCFF
jgi:hypothetical protein